MDVRKLVTLDGYDLHIADRYAGARTGTSRQRNYNADIGYVPATGAEGPTERDRQSWRGMVAIARFMRWPQQPEVDVESWATVNNQNTAPDIPASGRVVHGLKAGTVDSEHKRLTIRARDANAFHPGWIFVSALIAGDVVDLRGWATQRQIKSNRLSRIGYSGSGEEEQAWFMPTADLNPMWLLL